MSLYVLNVLLYEFLMMALWLNLLNHRTISAARILYILELRSMKKCNLACV